MASSFLVSKEQTEDQVWSEPSCGESRRLGDVTTQANQPTETVIRILWCHRTQYKVLYVFMVRFAHSHTPHISHTVPALLHPPTPSPHSSTPPTHFSKPMGSNNSSITSTDTTASKVTAHTTPSLINVHCISHTHRAQADGGRPISGDEHTLQVLVILPQNTLQQVSTLSTVCLLNSTLYTNHSTLHWCDVTLIEHIYCINSLGKCMRSSVHWRLRMLLVGIGTDWSVCSDSTVMDWKRDSEKTSLQTSRERHSKIMPLDHSMVWRSSGPSSSITRCVL